MRIIFQKTEKAMKENKIIGHNFDFQGKTIRHARLVDCEIIGGSAPDGGGSGDGSGSGCSCPYKAGTPVLIDQLPENSDFELTKAELAAAFGITEQDVDSVFELARPSLGIPLYGNDDTIQFAFHLDSVVNSDQYGFGVIYIDDNLNSITFVRNSDSYGYSLSESEGAPK